MTVLQLITEDQWRSGAEVLLALRPTLTISDFLARREQLQAEGYRFMGLSVGDDLKSVASFSISPHAVMRRELLVHDMATRRGEEKKGYASEILRYLEAVARSEGCGRVFVHTRNASHFYEKNGFTSYSTGMIKFVEE